MTSRNWGRTYEHWEKSQNMANDESVREAIAYERTGWPVPISGDLLAIKRYEERLALRHCEASTVCCDG